MIRLKYAAGECEYRIMARTVWARTPSCIYGGQARAKRREYARGPQALTDGNGCFDAEKKKQEESNALLMNNQGTGIRSGCGKSWARMTKDCTVIRYNKNCSRPMPSWSSCSKRFRKVN